ncbi:hypothetical protein [uncultured Muribaculum sp.]|uniref:hypothetical protein n=1 Tax=uncultured Muribaculum sp. TaxID=1918613 RepID=UPI002674669D|nr:hypothetical protein [uncultured Muribaculum sp.]
MIIKNISFIVLLVLCISCNSSNPNPGLIAEIQKEVEFANSKCPIYLGVGNDVVMDSLSFKDNTLTYNYSLAQIREGINYKDDRFKQSILYMLKGEAEMSPSNKKFYMNIIEVGGKLVYKYHVATGESITLEFTNKELKDNIVK